jgi:hypothetical protein
MDLSTLQTMNFTPLSETEADAATGEGGVSWAQCEEWLVLADYALAGYGCGGSYQDYMNLFNEYCK